MVITTGTYQVPYDKWINRYISSIVFFVSFHSKDKDQPGKVANPTRGQLFAPENLASRDGFGSPIRRQPAHIHTQTEDGAYLRDSSRLPRRRPFIYLNRHTPSGQFRVYRVTQLRTDGVYCRESAGTGPVNLKVFQQRVLPWQVIIDKFICASLSHTHYWYEVGMLTTHLTGN